jgi:hypothetical protein
MQILHGQKLGEFAFGNFEARALMCGRRRDVTASEFQSDRESTVMSHMVGQSRHRITGIMIHCGTVPHISNDFHRAVGAREREGQLQVQVQQKLKRMIRFGANKTSESSLMSNPDQSEIERFLRENKLSEFVQKCAEERIQSVENLAAATDDELKSLDMKLGDRLNLRAGLAKIKAGLFSSHLLSYHILSSPLVSFSFSDQIAQVHAAGNLSQSTL